MATGSTIRHCYSLRGTCLWHTVLCTVYMVNKDEWDTKKDTGKSSIAAEPKNHALFHKSMKLSTQIVLLVTYIFDIVPSQI